jgi:hypothetical protein
VARALMYRHLQKGPDRHRGDDALCASDDAEQAATNPRGVAPQCMPCH